jgi:hypothetical protein
VVHSLFPFAPTQVEGQPVQRTTVTAYLNIAYQHAYGEPFREAQPQHDEPEAQQVKKRKQDAGPQPEHAEEQAGQQQQAPAQAGAGVTTVTAMTQLLLFADAVGSTAPLLRACTAGIDKLRLSVQLPTEAPLDLSIRTPYFLVSRDSSSLTLVMVTEQQSSLTVATFSEADAPAAKMALVQQLQAQTEALLYVAYKLQLSEAAEAVQSFICMQTCFTNSVLWGAMRPVLSPRVMDAAAGCSSLQETLLLNHLVTRPCTFRRSGVPASLMPVDLTLEQRQPLRFNAEVVQDVLGSTREQGPRVPVEANILENTLKFGSQQYHMYPVLGPMLCSEQIKQAMLGPSGPAAE